MTGNGEFKEKKYGKKSFLIFHGGCLACTNQIEFGLQWCRGCQYYDANWGMPDLSISEEKEHDKIINILNDAISKIQKII